MKTANETFATVERMEDELRAVRRTDRATVDEVFRLYALALDISKCDQHARARIVHTNDTYVNIDAQGVHVGRDSRRDRRRRRPQPATLLMTCGSATDYERLSTLMPADFSIAESRAALEGSAAAACTHLYLWRRPRYLVVDVLL